MKNLGSIILDIIRIQDRNIKGFCDYTILLNSEPTLQVECLILTNKSGDNLFTSCNKNDMYYVIKNIFNFGKISEKIYSELYDKIYEVNGVVADPIEN